MDSSHLSQCSHQLTPLIAHSVGGLKLVSSQHSRRHCPHPTVIVSVNWRSESSQSHSVSCIFSSGACVATAPSSDQLHKNVALPSIWLLLCVIRSAAPLVPAWCAVFRPPVRAPARSGTKDKTKGRRRKENTAQTKTIKNNSKPHGCDHLFVDEKHR